ncbi:uncharacterized protein LOC141853923 [Brevipalpus obovatus]|uniref:uncharacterized protein LOC141853923 n=1 Tax=Brevipalpus obovatus TaxID=246614 RepID=UPI003D9F51F9
MQPPLDQAQASGANSNSINNGNNNNSTIQLMGQPPLPPPRPQRSASSTHGLPDMFITSLCKLFELLDENNTGFIKISELESRWKAIECDPKVPKGLINCLQSVQTANELIDFDSFCGAIKLCLLSASPSPSSITSNTNSNSNSAIINQQPHPNHRELSRPNQSFHHSPYQPIPRILPEPCYVNRHQILAESQQSRESAYSTVPRFDLSLNGTDPRTAEYYRILPRQNSPPMIREPSIRSNAQAGPPSVSSGATMYSLQLPRTQKSHSFDESTPENGGLDRTKSMPQLRSSQNGQSNTRVGKNGQNKGQGTRETQIRHCNSDPKLLRDEKTSSTTSTKVPMRSKIINLLKDWRNSVIQKSSSITNSNSNSNNQSQDNSTSGPIPYANIPRINTVPKVAPNSSSQSPDEEWGFNNGEVNVSNYSMVRRSHARRREERRHTVSHGIDINTLKRLQQFEQEKELLVQGLDMIEKARQWYMKSINMIQNKMRLFGQAATRNGDYSLDANQERINFQAARILTVNQHLASLMDNSRGFPLHMNLAIRPNLGNPQLIGYDINRQEALNNAAIQRLKEQNRQLTEEVGIKSEKITILEREKSALIRELFQSQSNPVQKTTLNDENDDNTFM